MGRAPELPIELSEDTIRTGAFLKTPWREQRKFSLHMLSNMGFGKTRMEENLKEEIMDVLEKMELIEGKPTKLADFLAPSMSNNIASLLFGRRMKSDDPKRQMLDKVLNEVALLAGAVTWQTFFPWIKPIMTYFNRGNKVKLNTANNKIKQYIREEANIHESTLDENNIRDFVDGYLLEIKKRSEDPNTTFTREVLIDVARGFFGAGSVTTRLSVEWMILICIAYPDVEKKIQDEIDSVLGRERFPTKVLSQEMPYTEAAITEMHRWLSIVPINLMRYTLEDTDLGGYSIPKHTRVMAVFYAVHQDKNLWGDDVGVFRPERFLSEDGKKFIKPECVIPFSIGKRQCPGKVFAEVEVFLYIVALLQKFKFSMPGGKRPDLEGSLGISIQPKRQDVVLKRR